MVTDTLLRIEQHISGRTEAELSTPSGAILPPQEEKEEGITTQLNFQVGGKATPRVLYLATLPDDRLRMKTPIEVEIEQENEFYIAMCDYLSEFGYGENPTEAIEDLQLVIVELYWTLKVEQEKLGPGMVEAWKRLRELVEEK